MVTNGHKSGHKNVKGNVAILNYKGRIRLRWTYLSKRYSLNLAAYVKPNLLQAKKVSLQIENDIVLEDTDILNKNSWVMVEEVQPHKQNKMLYRITKHWWPYDLFKIAATF